ncbi:hypothetical protein FRC12_003028 [Ceratobasidium sp. 428]|nr:hypothetical protein FRC12_003028 [Ceratobasidium sp. 428]
MTIQWFYPTLNLNNLETSFTSSTESKWRFDSRLGIVSTPYYSPIETTFEKLMRGEEITCAWTTWKYYIDIAMISHYLGMSGTQNWALKRLKPMLDQRIFSFPFDVTAILDAVHRMKLMGEDVVENSLRSLLCMQLLRVFSPRQDALYLRFSGPIPPSQPSSKGFVDTLYRDSTLRLGDRALFGQTICIILQAGHKSLMWSKELTRNERATLCAVQLYLTPLPETLDFSWFTSFTRRDETNNVPCSDTCKTLLESTKDRVFTEAAREQFRRDSPLGGIDALCSLLIRRAQFFVKTAEPKVITGSEEQHTICSKCRTHYMKKLDSEMNRIFNKLADLFEKAERDGYI